MLYPEYSLLAQICERKNARNMRVCTFQNDGFLLHIRIQMHTKSLYWHFGSCAYKRYIGGTFIWFSECEYVSLVLLRLQLIPKWNRFHIDIILKYVSLPIIAQLTDIRGLTATKLGIFLAAEGHSCKHMT